MNIFKLEITNSSNSSAIFDDHLIVKYNNNILLPLSTEFLKTELMSAGQLTSDKSLYNTPPKSDHVLSNKMNYF
jgi:hypothetical protein